MWHGLGEVLLGLRAEAERETADAIRSHTVLALAAAGFKADRVMEHAEFAGADDGDDLPLVPVLPERPAMRRTDAAHASDVVHDWLIVREAWGRVLGRLTARLCAPVSTGR